MDYAVTVGLKIFGHSLQNTLKIHFRVAIFPIKQSFARYRVDDNRFARVPINENTTYLDDNGFCMIRQAGAPMGYSYISTRFT